MELSIIITAWKSDKYIEQCLDSINNQFDIASHNVEVLLGVDDCDVTLEKIKNIKHKYTNIKLHVYKPNENVGTYILRNSLVNLAKYNYILFIDSDDYLERYAIREIDKVKNKEKVIKFKIRGFIMKGSNQINKNETFAQGAFFIHKKYFINALGGFHHNRFSSDTHLHKRSEQIAGQPYKIQKILYNYRLSNDNKLTKIIPVNEKERRLFTDRVINRINKTNLKIKNPIITELQKII